MLDGLEAAVEAGFGSGGQDRNRAFYGARLSLEAELSPARRRLLYDPQTSGGLLISTGPVEAPHLERALRQRGVQASQIARVTAPAPSGALRVTLG